MHRLRDILVRKGARRVALQSRLDAIVSQLAELGAAKVILFGSLARGEVDVHSDLDLLVIMSPAKSGKEWSKLIYEKVDRGIATDIVVYNEDEFKDELPVSSFLRNTVRSGRVVYEKTS